jgi:hypothetical protein
MCREPRSSFVRSSLRRAACRVPPLCTCSRASEIRQKVWRAQIVERDEHCTRGEFPTQSAIRLKDCLIGGKDFKSLYQYASSPLVKIMPAFCVLTSNTTLPLPSVKARASKAA